jgi:TPR repeat protein
MKHIAQRARVLLALLIFALLMVSAQAQKSYYRSMHRPQPRYSPRAQMQMQQEQQRRREAAAQTNPPPVTNIVQQPPPIYYAPPRPKPDPEKLKAEKERLNRNTVAWLKIRADDGSSSAQYSLGVRYLTGDGVEKNPELGRQLLRKAADAGEERAQRKLDQLDRAPKVEPEEPRKEEAGQQ